MAVVLRSGSEEAAASHGQPVTTDRAHYSQATAEGQPAVVTQVARTLPIGMLSYRTTTW